MRNTLKHSPGCQPTTEIWKLRFGGYWDGMPVPPENTKLVPSGLTVQFVNGPPAKQLKGPGPGALIGSMVMLAMDCPVRLRNTQFATATCTPPMHGLPPGKLPGLVPLGDVKKKVVWKIPKPTADEPPIEMLGSLIVSAAAKLEQSSMQSVTITTLRRLIAAPLWSLSLLCFPSCDWM